MSSSVSGPVEKARKAAAILVQRNPEDSSTGTNITDAAAAAAVSELQQALAHASRLAEPAVASARPWHSRSAALTLSRAGQSAAPTLARIDRASQRIVGGGTERQRMKREDSSGSH